VPAAQKPLLLYSYFLHILDVHFFTSGVFVSRNQQIFQLGYHLKIELEKIIY
jgi:hypothetical protein